jgi:hypothetical protein
MDKNNIIKLEFSSDTSNTIFLEYNDEYIIECVGKAAGIIENNYFSTKYKFDIDILNLKICDIHFINIIHVGENIENNQSVQNNNNFERIVNNNLFSVFNNTQITVNNNKLTIQIHNCKTEIDFLVLHIKLGAPNYNFSSSSSSSIKQQISNNNTNSEINNTSNSSNFSNSYKNTKTKKTSKNILKLVSWSLSISFIMHILKTNNKNN